MRSIGLKHSQAVMVGLAQRQLKVDRDDGFGRMVYMAHANNYVMCRRPGCSPFVRSKDDWLALPLFNKPKIK